MTYVVFQWEYKRTNGTGGAYIDMKILTKKHIEEAERLIKSLRENWSENIIITFWKELED